MKRCPACNSTYTDDLSFCLSDGTPLVGLLVDEQQTVVLPDTVVNRTSPAVGTGSSSVWKIVAAVAGMLLIFVLLGGAVVTWMFWPRNNLLSNTPARNDLVAAAPSPVRTLDITDAANTSRDKIKTREAELERERRELADQRKKLEEEKKREEDVEEPKDDDPVPPPPFTDPGTARLTFRRGSVGTTASGIVGRRRSYVLRTLAGQYLSASVSSPRGCVAFDGGSTTLGFSTGRGDSEFTVVNKCPLPSRFSLSVTVK